MKKLSVAIIMSIICAQVFFTCPVSAQFPSRFNWTDLGKVTPAKAQYPFGTCWSHAAVADIESKVLIRENLTYDFSEANLVTCNLNFGGAYQGGVVKIAINYLSIWGTVLESCDPYPGTIGSGTMICKNDTCAYYKVVTEWRLIEPDRDAIKQAILDYGPVQVKASTDYDYNYWDLYWGIYGTGLCTADQNMIPNHNMLITGWDDELCTIPVVSGGWIVKNSAGTDWGDNGYVYMAYGYGSVDWWIEPNVSVITAYKEWDPNETVYYYDEHGWMDQSGYGDGIDWAMIEVDPSTAGWLHAVNFWAVTGPLTYDLYIFDTFMSGELDDRIGDVVSGTLTEAGFYTIELPILVELTPGDPVYIAMRLDGHGYSDPLPIDHTGPMESNKCFISNNGSLFEAADAASLGIGDIGIRGRATTSIERGDPGFYDTGTGETIQAAPGQTVTVRIHPANFGGLADTPCNVEDSICVYNASLLPHGFLVHGSPAPLGSPIRLFPMSYINYDVNIEVPCHVSPGAEYQIVLNATYWEDGECLEGHYDCVDPNVYYSTPYFSTRTINLEIVENEEPFLVLGQDEVDVGAGIPQCGVRFDIENADACDSPCSYDYRIVSRGMISDPIDQEGTIEDIPAGETGLTFAVLDTRGASPGETDTLTMYAWRSGDPSLVDTSETAVHVVVSTDVEETPDLPAAFALEQNYPNPFNPVTEIRYALPEGCHVVLSIFDVSGRLVDTLVDRFEEAGYRSVTWNGTDARGISVSSGVYFYRVTAGSWSEQKKMILIR
jgi:C1A family cysteine protease